MIKLKHIASYSRLLVVALAAALIPLNQALAGSYDVQAVVPNDPPSQAAVFNPGVDGMNSTNAEISVSGTCQIANPQYIVTIWRAGAAIGSAPCNAGEFRLTIMLDDGDNQLLARTANVSNVYGPDSTTATITLRPAVNPVTPAPIDPTAPTPEPATPAQETVATNAGAASDLQAVTTEPFSTLSDGNTVTIGVNVTGGNSPYLIGLNWGDGSVESHWVDKTGVYTYSHTYQKASNYQVRGNIRDVLGAMTVFEYAVVTATSTPKPTARAAADVADPGQSIWPLLTILVGGTVVIAGLSYWLGAHHLARIRAMAKKSKPQSAAKNGKKKGTRRRVKKL